MKLTFGPQRKIYLSYNVFKLGTNIRNGERGRQRRSHSVNLHAIRSHPGTPSHARSLYKSNHASVSYARKAQVVWTPLPLSLCAALCQKDALIKKPVRCWERLLGTFSLAGELFRVNASSYCAWRVTVEKIRVLKTLFNAVKDFEIIPEGSCLQLFTPR